VNFRRQLESDEPNAQMFDYRPDQSMALWSRHIFVHLWGRTIYKDFILRNLTKKSIILKTYPHNIYP
jgi:hypothetical protein